MLKLDNVSLNNYDKVVFKNLSFSLLPGSITYIKGPNGSGKTSFLRIIAGIMSQSSGVIFLHGQDINNLNKPYSIYIGHNLAIKKNLKVIEMIQYYAEIFESKDSIEACIYYLGLSDILEMRCENLSHGNLKKLAITRLMLFKSDLWLLDEIESNLDESNLLLFHQLIAAKANNNGIVIISSNQQSDLKNSQKINLTDFI
jgi:heme exporter protein A